MRLKDREAAVKAATESILANSKSKTWGDAADWFDKNVGDEATFGPTLKQQFVIKADDDTKMVQLVLAVDEASGAAEVLDIMPMDEPVEGAAEDEVEEEKAEEEEEDGTKSARKARVMNGKMHKQTKGAPAVRSERARSAKAYDRAVSNGGAIRVPGMGKCAPVFDDSEIAEAFGASLRMTAAESVKGAARAYTAAARADDAAILQKIGTTTDNSNLGGFVAPEFLPGLIDLLEDYGVAPKVADFQKVDTDSPYINKHTGDFQTYLQGAEGTAVTKSNGTIEQPQLSLRTMITLAEFSNQLMSDSSISVGEYFSRSAMRSQAKAVDTEFFLGTEYNTGSGVTDILLAGGSNDNDTGATALSGVAIDDITDTLALLRGSALESEGLAIICSPQVYQGVFSRFVINATGPRREDLGGGGSVGEYVWDPNTHHLHQQRLSRLPLRTATCCSSRATSATRLSPLGRTKSRSTSTSPRTSATTRPTGVPWVVLGGCITTSPRPLALRPWSAARSKGGIP